MGHSSDPEVVGYLKSVSGPFQNSGCQLSVYGSAIVISHAYHQQVVLRSMLRGNTKPSYFHVIVTCFLEVSFHLDVVAV